jgi:glutathione-regulated potassium-efflux system ancillary protein KefF
VVEQTARFCGMNWLEPFVVYGAHIVPEEALRAAGVELRRRIEESLRKGVVSSKQ